MDTLDYTRFKVLAVENPIITGIMAFFVICIFTRIRTGIVSQQSSTVDSSKPQSPPTLPHWLPWFGHIIPYFRPSHSWMETIRDAYPFTSYSAVIASTKQRIITSPDLQAQILRSEHSITGHNYEVYVMKHIYGDRGETELLVSRGQLENIRKQAHHNVTTSFASKQPLTLILKILEETTFNLISGNSSWVDQSAWERSAGVQILSGKQNSSGNQTDAEAYLYTLIRDWVSDAIITTFMGRAFLENNLNFIEDFWMFDNKHTLFSLGLPYWVVPTLPPTALKRERLIGAIEEHHGAIVQLIDDKDPGSKYDNMDDVSNVIYERVKDMRATGCSSRYHGSAGLSFLWNNTVSVCQLTFWLVYHILATPGLLEEIRAETSPFVKIVKPEDTGLPFKDPPKLKIDGSNLVDKCPLMNNALHETMRLHTAHTSFINATQDIVVSESPGTPPKTAKQQPTKYLLKRGDSICMPIRPHNGDRHYFPNPHAFDPQRSHASNENEKADTVKEANLRTSKPLEASSWSWPSKSFAERAVTLFAASIVQAYDIKRADANPWTRDIPQKPTTSGFVPSKDIRVKLTRTSAS